MTREQLRKLVDICYQEFMEQPGAVPSTKWADQIIDKSGIMGPEPMNQPSSYCKCIQSSGGYVNGNAARCRDCGRKLIP